MDIEEQALDFVNAIREGSVYSVEIEAQITSKITKPIRVYAFGPKSFQLERGEIVIACEFGTVAFVPGDKPNHLAFVRKGFPIRLAEHVMLLLSYLPGLAGSSREPRLLLKQG